MRTSSQDLIEKQPHVELEMPKVVMDPTKALQEYKGSLPLPMHPTVLSPSTSITASPLTIEAPTLSSANKHPLAEELVDFHGLFMIKARRAQLLEEAFVKCPHLWEWKISQKTPRFCKWGYKTLAEMLEFLKLEASKAIMDGSKRKKFEYLCLELESFGFDKDWLASIRQRVMDMQEKLVLLESEISTLEDQIIVARARLASIKDDISKLDDITF